MCLRRQKLPATLSPLNWTRKLKGDEWSPPFLFNRFQLSTMLLRRRR
jgi:hypothetical protein